MIIKDEFVASLSNFTKDEVLHQSLWHEIESSYSDSNRHYHNLLHLNSLLQELSTVKSSFENWDTIVFAITYHDIVYNTLQNNNEEKSAELAIKRLTTISFPESATAFCAHIIRATKKHDPSDRETNLFTDADLSILGADAATYKEYSKNIRKEYSIYPDLLYNPGRKKVLQHFLAMSHIYKTKEFSDRYEFVARTNIQDELNYLSGN